VELKAFAGKVLLVTNVASACGYTEKNYQGLQRLYDKFRDRGFEARACSSVNLFLPQ
jgi:glutathione peroxidase